MFGWFGFLELGWAGIGGSSTVSFRVMAVRVMAIALGRFVLQQPQLQAFQISWLAKGRRVPAGGICC